MFKIKTLSPVHIGNGEKYNKLSYIYENNKIYFFDFDTLLKIFSSENLDKFISYIYKNMENLSLQDFIRNTLKNEGIYKKLKVKALYSLNCKSTIRHNDIECFIKSNNKVYIPGSEIKGAIRTAIFYWILKNSNEFYSELNKKVKELNDNYKSIFNYLSKSNKKAKDVIKYSEDMEKRYLELKIIMIKGMENMIYSNLSK